MCCCPCVIWSFTHAQAYTRMVCCTYDTYDTMSIAHISTKMYEVSIIARAHKLRTNTLNNSDSHIRIWILWTYTLSNSDFWMHRRRWCWASSRLHKSKPRWWMRAVKVSLMCSLPHRAVWWIICARQRVWFCTWLCEFARELRPKGMKGMWCFLLTSRVCVCMLCGLMDHLRETNGMVLRLTLCEWIFVDERHDVA